MQNHKHFVSVLPLRMLGYYSTTPPHFSPSAVPTMWVWQWQLCSLSAIDCRQTPTQWHRLQYIVGNTDRLTATRNSNCSMLHNDGLCFCHSVDTTWLGCQGCIERAPQLFGRCLKWGKTLRYCRKLCTTVLWHEKMETIWPYGKHMYARLHACTGTHKQTDRHR